ncbi:hypothetical protein Daesc_003835 [Daldinia eschscholtzii]|uniref:Uncharacterized protein n=1 Tax=Daldinia eschscholtzii TaxID=292717 RepID=A0AAX6MN44_9PEZI
MTRSPSSTPIKQQKAKREDGDDDDNQVAASPAPAKRVKISNSIPGTPVSKQTPPPESSPPSPKPLPESYMIEGLENDDMYRMVEDEFLSTAQQFTAHLHAAEYHRLKAASKSQNADTIRDISRPVVGRMTDPVKLKQERKARLEKQRAATRKAKASKGQNDDSTASESDLWRTASLHGLMESPRKKVTRLDNLTKVPTITRAAAGFSTAKPGQLLATSHPTRNDLTSSRPIPKSTSIHNSETESDDEDLDTPSTRVLTNTKGRFIPSMSTPTPQTPKPRQAPATTRDDHPLRRAEKVHPIIRQPGTRTTVESSASLDDEAGSGDFLSRLKQRQEDRKRNREQRSKQAAAAASSNAQSTNDDIIPGFL